ncbi:glycosyltransferase [Sellimonas intestinalis]
MKNKERNLKNQMIKSAANGLIKIIGIKRCYHYMMKYVKQETFQDSKWIASAVGGAGIERELIERKYFDNMIEMEFEGKRFYAPEGYEKYLTNLYGDYMQMPPKEKKSGVAQRKNMVEVENNIPEISIIMPVYNSETFLYLAVESVKRQTMKEWELLLIDDGSSDASGRLCDAYAKEDARIRVFHQENQGITKTRNRGIKEARGEFITFIDNDDEFVEDIMEKSCSYAKKYRADIVKFGYRVEEDFPNGAKEVRDNCIKQQLIITREQCGEEYQNIYRSGYFNMIWNGIYRRTLFEDKKLMFDESVIMGYEDWIFNNQMYLIPKRQVIMDYVGYIHYQRYQHSTSKKFHPNQIEANVKAAEAEYHLLRRMNQEYGTTFTWVLRATDYLIDILFLFERRGCNYGYRDKKKALKWVRSQKVFRIFHKKEQLGNLPKQRKWMAVLFDRQWYMILLILADLYYKFILWKKLRK